MPTKAVTKDTFQTEVLENPKPVLVAFWAPWCVYCRRLVPVLERLSDKLGETLPIVTLNVDEQHEVSETYAVSVVPTLYLFRNGAHGERLGSPSSEAQIEEWLKEQEV